MILLAECATLDGLIEMHQWSAENWASLPMVDIVINLYVWQLQTFYTILGYQSKIAGSGPDHNTLISSLNSCFNCNLPTMFLYGEVAASSVCPIFSVLRL